MPANEPRILFIDIETLPNVAWTWGKYQQDVLGFERQSCIATVAYKWLGKPVRVFSQPDFPLYAPKSYDDKYLVQDIWKLLDQADIAVAHNGKAFDFKVISGRFIVHGLKPPSPYKIVDTKLLAKRVARYNSNKLDDLGDLLNLGRKIHTDFGLWKGCMDGDPKAWAKMERYNKQDVVLLEKVYLRLRPWDSTHPNVALYRKQVVVKPVCPKCGSYRMRSNGHRVANTRRYQRLVCLDCGGWARGTASTGSVGVTNAA
ncbi:MAG: ribonuclease H-like domain-containing protein [Patescibacteria group bacterium]|nr:ribonuclease H-like domain-containing protein [Patescibacteria group bacterium]